MQSGLTGDDTCTRPHLAGVCPVIGLIGVWLVQVWDPVGQDSSVSVSVLVGIVVVVVVDSCVVVCVCG